MVKIKAPELVDDDEEMDDLSVSESDQLMRSDGDDDDEVTFAPQQHQPPDDSLMNISAINDVASNSTLYGSGGTHEGLRLPRQLKLNAMKMHLLNQVMFSNEGDDLVSRLNTNERNVSSVRSHAKFAADESSHRMMIDNEEPTAGGGDDDDDTGVMFPLDRDTAEAYESDDELLHMSTRILPPPRGVSAYRTMPGTHVEPMSVSHSQPLGGGGGGSSSGGARLDGVACAAVPTFDSGPNALRTSFRVGWGPRGSIIRYAGDGRVIIERVEALHAVGGCTPTVIEQCLQAHYDCHHHDGHGADATHARNAMDVVVSDDDDDDHNNNNNNDGVPSALSRLCDAYIDALQDDSEFARVSRSLWQLVKALWSPEHGSSGQQHSDYLEDVARRDALSQWLADTLEKTVESQLVGGDDDRNLQSSDVLVKNMFTYMTGYQLEAACDLGVQCGDVRLALLIAQAGDSYKNRMDMANQVKQWMREAIWNTMDPVHQLVYRLLSGDVAIDMNMSWIQSLGLHMWYGLSPNVSVPQVIGVYERAWTNDLVPKPLPPWRHTHVVRSDRAALYDTRYGLVNLYCHNRHEQLRELLLPESLGDNRLDYHTSWLVYDMTKHLQCGTFARWPQLCVSFAWQLESLGLWHWAVYVLMYSQRTYANGPSVGQFQMAVKEILCRNWPLPAQHTSATLSGSNDTFLEYDNGETTTLNTHLVTTIVPNVERFLLDQVQVPAHWIEEARALGCQYSGDRWGQVRHLLNAGLADRAHSNLLLHLVHGCIVPTNYGHLLPILQRMKDAQDQIPTWSSGGAVYYEYIRLMSDGGVLHELHSDLGGSGGANATTDRAQAVHDALRSLIASLPNLPKHSTASKVATAEMAPRLVLNYHQLSALLGTEAGANLVTPELGMVDDACFALLDEKCLTMLG